MGNIEIREATLNDVKALAQLFSAHLSEQVQMDPIAMKNPAFNAEGFISGMMNPKLNQFYVATDDDKIVGFVRLAIRIDEGLLPLSTEINRVSVSYLKRLPTALLKRGIIILDSLKRRLEKKYTIFSPMTQGTCGYLADMYVLPEYRRQGIGSKLFDLAQRWFSENGITHVELNVLAKNLPGRSFWKSKGFEDRRLVLLKSIQ